MKRLFVLSVASLLLAPLISSEAEAQRGFGGGSRGGGGFAGGGFRGGGFAGGGIAGAILTAIVGLIKNRMAA